MTRRKHPAAPVKVTKADGSTEIRSAKSFHKGYRQKPKRTALRPDQWREIRHLDRALDERIERDP